MPSIHLCKNKTVWNRFRNTGAACLLILKHKRWTHTEKVNGRHKNMVQKWKNRIFYVHQSGLLNAGKESHSGACTFQIHFLHFNVNAFPSEKNEDQITSSFVKKLALGHNNGPIFVSTHFKVKFGLTKFHFPAIQTLNLLALTTGFPGAVLVASHYI